MADKTPEDTFDLTTLEGMETVLARPWAWALFPQAKAALALYRWISSPSDVSPARQAEAAETIIEAGKRNGVKRLRLKVSKDVGAIVQGNVKGATVKGGLGSNGTMELDVEYFPPMNANSPED